jgi:magnesium-protoporphyrin O-methyltransferase
MTDTVQHKDKLLAYFNGLGFERWSAIYGDAKVSRIRRTIREGHAAMLGLAEHWLLARILERESHSLAPATLGSPPVSVLDAGCGTGLLSIDLAQFGLRVTAVDIAPQMVGAAEQSALSAGVHELIDFQVGDIEQVSGSFDVVVCLDVLIHYPAAAFAQMLHHLARQARSTLLLTYAPSTPLLTALHWIGGHFPSAHRRTEIQMIPRRRVEQALADAGMRVQRTAQISQGFYHVTLVEAVRK